MWHLTQPIQSSAVGFTEINPQTMQGNDSVVGESATFCRGGGFVSSTDSIFANVTTFRVKREIFDMSK